MPNIDHQAIIVTGFTHASVLPFHTLATELELEPTDLTPEGHHCVTSFLVPPCGAGRGRPAAADHLKRLGGFLEALMGKGEISYVAVSFGDEFKPEIIASDWHELES